MKYCLTCLTLILLLLLSNSSLADSTLRLNYNQCVEMALKNNDQIRAANNDILVSRGKLDQAHPRGIPVIKYENRFAPVPQNIDDMAESFFDGDISPFYGFKIELGSALSTFGKIKTAQSLAEMGIQGSELKKEKTANDTAYTIYQLYQGILLARDLLGLASQARDAINGKIKNMEEDKTKDQIGILKLKVALYELDRKVEEAKKKEILAMYTLKFQIGIEEYVPFDLANSGLTRVAIQLKPVDYYLEQAKQYLPEFKLLNIGIAAKEKQVKLNQLDLAPNFGAGGFFDAGFAPNIRGGEDENAFTNPFNYKKAGVGFQLKGELDFVKNRALVRQSKADLVKTIYERRAAIRGLELDLRKTYQDVIEARHLMKKSDDEIKAAKQLVFLTKSNADIGIGEKKDYFDALQSYLIFQGRQLEAIFNYNVAVASLKKRIGELFEEQRKE